MLTEAYLEPSRTSTMEPFLLWLSYILKTYLIDEIAFLGSIFYTTHSFIKKNYNCENFKRKSILQTMEQFSFEIRNYAMEQHHHRKMNKESLLIN